MANTEKFTGKSDVYRRFRPDYPQALLDYLEQAVQLNASSVIADVGAGTGILTKQLLDRKSFVRAVEPNREMQQASREYLVGYEKVTFIRAEAEATGLSEHSIDLITVAQAFHWFEPRLFHQECQRILKPGGFVALIWNSRDPSGPLTVESRRICQRYCRDFHGFSGGAVNRGEKIKRFFENGCREKDFPHPLSYTLESFIGRYLSASYAPKEEDKLRQPFIDALIQLFNRFAKNGAIPFPNATKLYLGQIG